jgi:hypothetical protein
MNAAMWIGKQAAKARQRGGEAGHALEDRNREAYDIFDPLEEWYVAGLLADARAGAAE